MGEPKDVVTWGPAAPGIWRVTMASPPANALSGPLLDGLHAALDAAEAAGDVKVLVVTSAVSPRVLDSALTDRLTAFTWDGTHGSGILEFALTRSPSYTYQRTLP